MREKKQKVLTSWTFLFFLFVVISLILMLRLITESAKTERAEVEEHFMDMVEDCAADLRDILTDMREQGKMVGIVAGTMEAEDEERINATLFSLTGNSNNYLAVLCDNDGSAIYRLEGEENIGYQNISSFSYFTEIKDSGKSYLYVKEDGFTGKAAIICISPVEKAGEKVGIFLQYYDVSLFRNIAKRAEYGTGSHIYAVDGEGNIIAYTGLYDNYLEKDHNIWDELRKNQADDNEILELQNNLQTKSSSVNYISQDNGRRVYVSARIGILDWNVVTELTASYMDKQVKSEQRDAKNAAVRMIILNVIFCCVVLVNIIVSRTTDKETHVALEAKADTDLLTDLYNKAATERKIREYIAEHPGEQALMFVLDIDNFKKINDTMGHAFGDEVLRAVGTMVKAEFRASDIIGRTGGDEFTIFLKQVKDEEELKKHAERILQCFHNLSVGEYVKYSPNASIGAATFPDDATDFETLYKAADAALYVAKRRGKNQLAFYNEE